MLTHLTIRKQMRIISGEKVSLKEKISNHLHLFFCRHCREELKNNRAEYGLIGRIHANYTADDNSLPNDTVGGLSVK